MKIYTKTGDKGTTSLIGGQRVTKNNDRLNAYGSIDELNSFLGLLRAKLNDAEDKNIIKNIQNTLFTIGAQLATDETTTKLGDYAVVDADKTTYLENLIDKFQSKLPPINNFIIYGEDEISAICHICRAVSRRAEREIITVNQNIKLQDNLLTYINRLSDFLYVFARIQTRKSDNKDFFWKK